MKPPRVVLITGGAAGGKSRYAVERAKKDFGPRVLFIATCDPRDDEEMRRKIARHRAERPAHWRTVETFRNVPEAYADGFDGAILDCLTLLVSQLLVAGARDEEIFESVSKLLDAPFPLFLVTNEAGWGVVPDNDLARRFRETIGRANQIAARRADEVVLMVSGIPVHVKGGPAA